jgi:hypothetical protein
MTGKATLLVCCLALVSAAPAAEEEPFTIYDAICTDPGPGCTPEQVARARAHMAAYEAELERRYREQQSLTVPTIKPDLTLVCGNSNSDMFDDAVNIWFGAGLLTWGVGEPREVWRLDRVSAAEITFKRVTAYQPGGFFDAKGHIDRVTGQFARDIARGGQHTVSGECRPAATKF